tara:strand:- start:284 stop:724 length:441 start_codon:yes stop_codon:yes gene_type:complete
MKPNLDKSNSLTSTRKNIRFDNKLLAHIDTARGDKPFGTWVQEICSAAIKLELSESMIPTEASSNPVRTPVRTPVQTVSRDPVHTFTVQEQFKNDYATTNGLPSNITEELHIQILELSALGLTSRAIAEKVVVSKSSVLRTINARK